MFPQIRWRIAISYFILVTVVMAGLAVFLSRPGCLGNAGCVRQAVSITAVILLITSSIIASPVAARTTRSMRKLTQIMRRITQGEWEARMLPSRGMRWAS